MIALAPGAIDPAALLEAFAGDAGPAGAVVSFTGLVRPDSGVATLWLDHHERLTLAAMEALGRDTCARFGLTALAIVHRVGAVAVGEPILFVAAAAAHRRAAFDAVDFAMDALKTDIPLWKCEDGPGGRNWIEARPCDHADAARWASHG